MKSIYNFKISTKLLAGFILVSIIAGAMGLFGMLNLVEMRDAFGAVHNKITVPVEQMSEISTAFQRTRVELRDMVFAQEQDDILGHQNAILQKRDEIDKLTVKFGETIVSGEIKDYYNDFLTTKQEFNKEVDIIMEAARNNKDAEAVALIDGTAGKITKQQQDIIKKLLDLKVEAASNSLVNRTNQANNTIFVSIIIMSLVILISIFIGIALAIIIGRPLKKAENMMSEMKSGQLGLKLNLNTKDEIGKMAKAMDEFSENLQHVLFDINNTANQVEVGSLNLSDASQALSTGASEQASSVEELTASINQIASQTRENAENANEGNKLSLTAKEHAETGNEKMKVMLKSMEEINESSSNISKVIKVIDEIAFQTNILALNAAVEAARAGQHGKGFAVVAEEVRNLAARSANAVKETTDMINGSIQKAEMGTKIALETAQALNTIVKEVEKSAALVAHIATSSNEQATAIDQINRGIEEVSKVVQENSATAQESAASSEELSSHALALKEMINKFKFNNSGVLKSGNKNQKTEALPKKEILLLN